MIVNKEKTKAMLKDLKCKDCLFGKKYVTDNVIRCVHDAIQCLVSPNKCFCEYEFFRCRDEKI